MLLLGAPGAPAANPIITCRFTADPETNLVQRRGFLITTRRKVLVEDNAFHATVMSAILVESDARGWFESGPVQK